MASEKISVIQVGGVEDYMVLLDKLEMPLTRVDGNHH